MRNLLLFGVANFLWLMFRTGTKPSRIVYPCQRAALANSSMMLSALIPLSATAVLIKTKFLSKSGKAFALLLILAGFVIFSGDIWGGSKTVTAVDPFQEIQLRLFSRVATTEPSSDIFVVNGRKAPPHVDELLQLMGSNSMLFYKSNSTGSTYGPDGFISYEDIVLIKINSWGDQRGGTNTDTLKEIIQAIVDHPDGFAGEIVVADNGQGHGSLNWGAGNAEDHAQSAQDVVDLFLPQYNISTFDWSVIRATRVDEYSAGDTNDGYILYDDPDPETGIYVSYPKFRTIHGTCISFKRGIWNGTAYENRLKMINVPVLKSHSIYGVTACLKLYMGVQSEGAPWSGGLGNGHYTVGTGGMGTLMAETRLPTLNILDAVWVNANPWPSEMVGPETRYEWATRVNVLAASTDPVALDYWASKHVLVQTAKAIGYTTAETQPLDPDNTTSIVGFGYWLNPTKDEILTAGYNVTSNKDQMNVYVDERRVHDVAVTDVLSSQTEAFPGDIISVYATVENQGDFSETFNVTAFYDSNLIGTKEVFLMTGSSTTLGFSWNTTDVILGNYTIGASASIIANETDITDNTYINGIVTIRLPIHDIAVTEVEPSGAIAGKGYPVSIKVTVVNQGDFAETFNVTISLNQTEIVTLPPDNQTTLTFMWDTSSFAYGNYTISAIADTVPGETDTFDNTWVYGTILVTIPGDIDGDRDVDLYDAVKLLVCYGAREGNPKYDPNCDIDGDGDIDLYDAVILLTHYGQNYP